MLFLQRAHRISAICTGLQDPLPALQERYNFTANGSRHRMSESGTNTGSFARASLPRWQSQAANPVAWGIIAVVAVVVAGAHFLAVSLRPSHMKEIADELG